MSGAGAPMVGAGLCCAACGLGLALGFPLPSPGSRTHPALGVVRGLCPFLACSLFRPSLVPVLVPSSPLATQRTAGCSWCSLRPLRVQLLSTGVGWPLLPPRPNSAWHHRGHTGVGLHLACLPALKASLLWFSACKATTRLALGLPLAPPRGEGRVPPLPEPPLLREHGEAARFSPSPTTLPRCCQGLWRLSLPPAGLALPSEFCLWMSQLRRWPWSWSVHASILVA